MEGLAQFQFFLEESPNGFMTLADGLGTRSEELLAEVAGHADAPTTAVAASIFMRRFGLFIAGQLYLLANGKVWDGPAEEIRLIKSAHGISFAGSPRFLRNRQEGDLSMVLKEQALPAVEAIRKSGNVSKLILWENIWGYVIWMYSMEHTAAASEDSGKLLDDSFWQPEMKRSFFRQFLGGRTLAESQADYRRVTCCLYKELPGTDKCPYCPLNNRN
ncbi:hypothetical protein [Indiicoccus explosivorum]|uniref:hypothetical protein n=1 Tax=Indiicoccus explosivorum TaxID=1917864 RepID=UPI000B439CD2|nr:hypothetical protein [Indiicoccus explosivorum]